MSLRTLTVDELLDELEELVSIDVDSRPYYEEIRRRLTPQAFIPQTTFDTARSIFGDCMFNTGSRTYQALAKRVEHALRVWDEKYGPMNGRQELYADDVLSWALRQAQRDAGGDRKKLWPYAQAGIGRIIQHETVHEGFVVRAEYVDVTATLKGLTDGA